MTDPSGPNELMDFDASWNYADPEATGVAFRELLPAARSAGDVDYLAQLLTQIARTEGLRQRFDQAHAILDEVDGLLDDSAESTGVARVRALLERGRTFNSSGERDRARPLFVRAFELARELGHDVHAVDAAHMLEIVTDGEDKLTWNATACAIAEATPSERARRWLSSLYNNRGWSLHELERHDEALGVFEKRLAYLEANDPRPDQISIARWSIAKTLRLLGRPADALAIQLSLLESSSEDGYVHEELGECLLALERVEEARPHCARAHELLKDDPWLVRDEAPRLDRLARIGSGGETR